MASIPTVRHEHINTAFPANVCLVASVLPNGFAPVSPRGSTMVFHDESGAAYEEIWTRLIQPEKDRDPGKKGFGVLIKVGRAEDVDGFPLDLK